MYAGFLRCKLEHAPKFDDQPFFFSCQDTVAQHHFNRGPEDVQGTKVLRRHTTPKPFIHLKKPLVE